MTSTPRTPASDPPSTSPLPATAHQTPRWPSDVAHFTAETTPEGGTAVPQPRFDRFYRHPDLTALLHAYAAAFPALVSVDSIGRSHEGREIWVATITNRATGDAAHKPAFWCDGNIHAAELTASTACLYYLHQLLTGYGAATEAGRQTTRLLDTRVVYLCPRLNPDGAELALGERPRHIRSSTRKYPFDEPTVDGLTVQDMNDDGRILYMRVPDANGGYKKCERDERLMVPREPGEFGGSYYRVMPEGLLANHDGVTVRLNPDAEGLDLNRNFPAGWRQEHEQQGAGPFPTSEPEVRAMVEFVTAHRNIGAAVSFHTHSGVILRPSGSQSDDDMTPEDLWSIKRFTALGEKLTGYPTTSIYHGFRYHPKELLTGSADWIYEHLGALFWTVELWAPNREAGIHDYGWVDWYREHPVEDDLKLLKWSDEQCDGQAHAPWRPFQHPQLGAVEIGGWDRMNFWRNPPPNLREREAARFPAWMTRIALSLPRLELLLAEAQPLGGGHWRVRLAVFNGGYLPAYITKRALQRKAVRGVMFEIELPDGAALVGGKPRFEGPQLEGHAPKGSLQGFAPQREITGDRAVAEWIVAAPQGTRLALTARADRAGTVRCEVSLD